MTDARLPGHWLNELRFADLDDRTWRIFTNALMWSAEQGTDGLIPAKYVRKLHDVDVTMADLVPLIDAGVFVVTDAGDVTMPGWSDDRGLRQSSAATVAQYRERKRGNQAAYRQRARERSESGHVTGHVPGNVGEGSTEEISNGASAYVNGNTTGHVTGHALRRNCDAHPDGWSQPCRACGEARKRADAANASSSAPRMQTVSPGSRCSPGRHRLVADGTCMNCDVRAEDVA